MNRLSLDPRSLALLAAKEDVVSRRRATDWAVFAYGKCNELKLLDSGAGGADELAEKFSSSSVMYGLCRTQDPSSGQPCIVLINWVGEKVPESHRQTCAGHLPAIKAFFKEASLVLSAHRPDEVTQEGLHRVLSQLLPAGGAVSGRAPASASEELVGTNYRKTNPALEIRRTKRDCFWAQAEREEQQRKEEERRRAQEERTRWERQRMEEEKREAAERERRCQEKERLIEEQRKEQARLEAEERRKEKARWEQQQRDHEEAMRDRFRRSESIEKAVEAAVLVSQRSQNPREFFRQRECSGSGSSSGAQSPPSPLGIRPGAPRRPYLRYQRSLTESAYIFRRPEPPASPNPSEPSPSGAAPPRSPFRPTDLPPASPPGTGPLSPASPPGPPTSLLGTGPPASPPGTGTLPPAIQPRVKDLPHINPDGTMTLPPISLAEPSTPPPASPPRAESPPPASPPRPESPPPASPPRAESPPPASPPRAESPPPASPPRAESPPPASPPRAESPPPASPPRAESPPPASPPRAESPPPASHPRAESPPPASLLKAESPFPGGPPRAESPPPASPPRAESPFPASPPRASTPPLPSPPPSPSPPPAASPLRAGSPRPSPAALTPSSPHGAVSPSHPPATFLPIEEDVPIALQLGPTVWPHGSIPAVPFSGPTATLLASGAPAQSCPVLSSTGTGSPWAWHPGPSMAAAPRPGEDPVAGGCVGQAAAGRRGGDHTVLPGSPSQPGSPPAGISLPPPRQLNGAWPSALTPRPAGGEALLEPSLGPPLPPELSPESAHNGTAAQEAGCGAPLPPELSPESAHNGTAAQEAGCGPEPGPGEKGAPRSCTKPQLQATWDPAAGGPGRFALEAALETGEAAEGPSPNTA